MNHRDGSNVTAAAAAAAAAAAVSSTSISNSTHWSTEETRLLIKTWGEHRDEFAEIKRNLSVWNKVLERLLNAGFFRTVEQCRNRWKFLETKYKAAAREIEAGGRNTWGEFFDEMHLAKNGPEGTVVRRRASYGSSSNGSVTAASRYTANASPDQTPPPGSASVTSAGGVTNSSSSIFSDPQGRVHLPPIRSPTVQHHVPSESGVSATRSSHDMTVTTHGHYQYQPQPSPHLQPPSQSPSSISSRHRHRPLADCHNQTSDSGRVRSASPPQNSYYEGQSPAPYGISNQGSPRRSSSARNTLPYQVNNHHHHHRQLSGNYHVHPLSENHLPDSLLSSKASSISPSVIGSSSGAHPGSISNNSNSNSQQYHSHYPDRRSPTMANQLRPNPSLGHSRINASPTGSTSSINQMSALRSGYPSHHRTSSMDNARSGTYPQRGSDSPSRTQSPASQHAFQRLAVSNAGPPLPPAPSGMNRSEYSPRPSYRNQSVSITGPDQEIRSPVPRKRKLELPAESEPIPAPTASAVFSAIAGSVVSEGSTVELVGQVQRVDLLDFLKEQARVREQREALRAEERRHAERLRSEEEMRFHEFQMSLITLIKNTIAQPDSEQSPMETEEANDPAVVKKNKGKDTAIEPDQIKPERLADMQGAEDGEVSDEVEMRSRTSTPAVRANEISTTSSCSSPQVEPARS
ncbi:hypothetical protein GGI15_001370 [Coemansia interrupta]|uniref:Myb-like domain-containing protein n=1 Tax=Coemansia interrupta TaxID=1126814 RepID=A0A9W8HRC5_9FUNG|nr:hypothetical protein GGI15_001370 [Coemansia interrupta]